MAKALLSDKAVKELSFRVVEQAVMDWRYLCKGGKPDIWCNFGDLELFFERGCDGMIEPEAAERLYELLKLERGRVKHEVSLLA